MILELQLRILVVDAGAPHLPSTICPIAARVPLTDGAKAANPDTAELGIGDFVAES